MEDVLAEDPKLRMEDLADKTPADPPALLTKVQPLSPKQDLELMHKVASVHESEDEPIDWSESESEAERVNADLTEALELPAKASKSPSLEFEDVPLNPVPPTVSVRETSPLGLQGADDLDVPIVPYSGIANDNAPLDNPDNVNDSDPDQYSDPEDAELFASLAAEAEEHARFAQELNAKQVCTPNQLRARTQTAPRTAEKGSKRCRRSHTNDDIGVPASSHTLRSSIHHCPHGSRSPMRGACAPRSCRRYRH